jgi:sortase A
LRAGLGDADSEDELIRRIGTLAIVAGLGVLAWTGTVYVWKDPFTTAYTAYQQRKLDGALERTFEEWRTAAPRATEEPRNQKAPTPNTSEPPQRRELRPAVLRREASRFAAATGPGDAIARLEIDRIDLDVVVVDGTDTGNLRKGPGRHLETAMPGEGGLVYIAGHRTTYGAPFSRIDHLARGDAIVLELPYASIEYEVTSSRIVDQYEVSVLESRGREELVLQACHPRFFSSHRYLVYAKPVHVYARQAA